MWRVEQQTPTELLTLQIFTKYFLNYCWQISDEALISAQSIGCCQSSISQLSSGRRCGCDSGVCIPVLTAEKPRWENLPHSLSPCRGGDPAWDVKLRSVPGEVSPAQFTPGNKWESPLFSFLGQQQMLLLFCHCSVERKGWCCEEKWPLHS